MGKQTEEGKSGVVNLGFYVAGYSDITEQEKHLTVGIRAQTHVLISISFLTGCGVEQASIQIQVSIRKDICFISGKSLNLHQKYNK